MKNRKLFYVLVVTFLSILSVENVNAEDASTPKLSFEAISDTHIPGIDNSHPTNQIFINTLDYLRDQSPETELIMNMGDFTDRGLETHMRGYYNILNDYENDFDFMTGLGNHEVMYINFAEGKERFLRYNQKYMPKNSKNVYYEKWINGYHFIMLGTEHLLHMESYISNEQLDWLDKTMAEGADPDKPIFVGIHQPLRDTFKNSNRWPVGVQDHALKEILRKYPQTILFSGHLHDGLGNLEVLQKDYGTVVNVPSLRYNEPNVPGGERTQGELGYQVRVFEDYLEIALRDYKNKKWIPKNSYTIDLNASAKPIGKILDINFDDETMNDNSGYENHGQIIGDVEYVKGNNEGKALHLLNGKGFEKISEYIQFPSVNLSNEDFTLSFSYKDQEKNQWHHATVVVEQENKDHAILYINGRKVKEIPLNGQKYNQLDEKLFRLIFTEEANLKRSSINLIIDDLKLYHFALGASEIETMNLPFSIDKYSNNIELNWEGSMPNNREPDHILVNGQKYKDFSSDETYLNISNLESNRTYDIKVVTRYTNNKNRLAGVYSFKVKTGTADHTKDKLIRLYNLHKDKLNSDYTKESWILFEAALNNAKFVLDKYSSTQEEIESSIDELVEAVEGLIENGKWKKNDKGWWYQNPANAKERYPKNKWQQISNKWYYFDKEGYMQTGWINLSGKQYYLAKDGAMTTGWLTINRMWFYFSETGERQIGWTRVKDEWYYLNNNGIMQTGWLRVDNSWYYLSGSGEKQTGWVEINNEWYYLNSEGVMQTDWLSLDDSWYYLSESGEKQTGWTKVKNRWYYLESDGVMQTGWLKIKNKWYYMNASGTMQTGWTKVKNSWYYMNSSGSMQTGWTKVKNKWYYLNSSGSMQTGWTKVKNIWYYMNSSGVMQTGWTKVKNTWYYTNSSGSMQTGWIKIKNNWYYLNSSGVMQTGWTKVNNNWYYLYSDGSMATNTTIDDYKINKNGVI